MSFPDPLQATPMRATTTETEGFRDPAMETQEPDKRDIMSMSGVTLQDLLVVEDDPLILDFRCGATGIPVWTQIRSEVVRKMISDLFYQGAWDGTTNAAVPKSQAFTTMGRSILNNLRFRLGGRCHADVCLVATAAGNQWIDGKWFNRLSDHFALACPSGTIAIESHFEWKWPVPRHNQRVIYRAPLQAANAVMGRLQLREGHRRQAEGLLSLVFERAKRYLDWEPGADRKQALVDRLSRKIASLPHQYRAYEALLTRIQPKLIIVEEACYGATAALMAAARRRDVVTAEYQHGGISAGHDAYNFAPTIRESREYRETLPEHFLGYGGWWNDQINAPVTKIAIGNPHREAKLAQTPTQSQAKEDILILSDGAAFSLYFALAEEIASAAAKRGLRVVLRPHPLERSVVRAKYGDRIGEVSVDQNEDLYASLSTAHVVISEVSTGLFDAAGLADKIFIWDTPKSRFTYPRHPFQTFSSASMFLDLLNEESAGRLPASDLDAIWAPSWRANYLGFLERHGVRCTEPRSLP